MLMKPIAFLTLMCAALLSVSPAYAHGDEQHGETASVAASSESAHDNDGSTQTGGAPGESAEAGHGGGGDGSAGHGEAAGGHDEASEGGGGFVGLLKKLHPATVHFPIALFLMAVLTELFVMSRRTSGLEPAVRVMIYGGAAGAAVAALFGWIHTGLWFGGETAMQVHRWNGTLLAIFGVVLAGVAYGRRENRSALRVLLFLIAAGVLVQGFLGGELAHGPNHLGM